MCFSCFPHFLDIGILVSADRAFLHLLRLEVPSALFAKYQVHTGYECVSLLLIEADNAFRPLCDFLSCRLWSFSFDLSDLLVEEKALFVCALVLPLAVVELVLTMGESAVITFFAALRLVIEATEFALDNLLVILGC